MCCPCHPTCCDIAPAWPRCASPPAGSTVGGAPTTRGGSDTSLENNNVYGLEPKVYVEGSEAAPQTGEQAQPDWQSGVVSYCGGGDPVAAAPVVLQLLRPAVVLGSMHLHLWV